MMEMDQHMVKKNSSMYFPLKLHGKPEDKPEDNSYPSKDETCDELFQNPSQRSQVSW